MRPDHVREAVVWLNKLENVEKLMRAWRGVAKAKIVVEATQGSPAYNIGGEAVLSNTHAIEILEALAEQARTELRRLGVAIDVGTTP